MKKIKHTKKTFRRQLRRFLVVLLGTTALLLLGRPVYFLSIANTTEILSASSNSQQDQPKDDSKSLSQFVTRFDYSGFSLLFPIQEKPLGASPINEKYLTKLYSNNITFLDGDMFNISLLLSMDQKREFFSGLGQDRTVYDLMGDKNGSGFYIDLAARHPLETSNTRALERELAWKGLCIEANERNWNQLAILRRCTAVGAVVADQFYPNVTFAGVHKGSGGIVMTNDETLAADSDERLANRQKQQAMKNKQKQGGDDQFTSMSAVALHRIMDTLNVPSTIDYLSLDVEGAEDLVLSSSFPWDRYTFTLITIEGPFGKDSSSSLARRLKEHGYRWLCQTGGVGNNKDNLWAHETFSEPASFRQNQCKTNCQKAIQHYQKYGFQTRVNFCA